MCNFGFFSAGVTAVFQMEDGTVKRFTRSVQGTSSDYKINREVCYYKLLSYQKPLFSLLSLYEIN